ncbi:hypothetical protein Tco_1215556 [Tanacetum coccineum]
MYSPPRLRHQGINLTKIVCHKTRTGEKKVDEVDFISQKVKSGVSKTLTWKKSLSEIQLEHEKEDRFVVLIISSVKGLYVGGEEDCEEILGGSGGESFWEEDDGFGVDVLRLHLVVLEFGFREKLG